MNNTSATVAKYPPDRTMRCHNYFNRENQRQTHHDPAQFHFIHGKRYECCQRVQASTRYYFGSQECSDGVRTLQNHACNSSHQICRGRPGDLGVVIGVHLRWGKASNSKSEQSVLPSIRLTQMPEGGTEKKETIREDNHPGESVHSGSEGIRTEVQESKKRITLESEDACVGGSESESECNHT